MIYFASDFHLGIPDHAKSLEREKKIVRWLDFVSRDATHIYLLGDIFDFWFEYKYVVPKGYVRLLGKLAELTDKGIKITAFKGNHDMWMFGYFEKELNIPVIENELVFESHGRTFYLHHGDGLGPGDKGYKFLKKVFRSPLCIWLFSKLPPAIGMRLAGYFSSKSRLANVAKDEKFYEDNEWLLIYCREIIKTRPYDYLIFGHRHLPLYLELKEGPLYVNLGEWVHQFTYAVFDGITLELKSFEGECPYIIRKKGI
ncbi:MAG: UDP-2,3-diacylglucosamine diphosphatase [Bacteroidetes bacterium]|nr:UDP-2,3-diacylglucosamine diphosphatase [Bacteroidota bacterium]